MTIKTWFQSHGWGVTQTNQSLTAGLASRTNKTPATEYESQVRPDGVDRERINHMRQEVAKKSSKTAHLQYNGDNLKGRTADLQNPNEWENVFTAEQRRRFPGSTFVQMAHLKEQMAWVQENLAAAFKQTPDVRAEPREARILPGTTMLTLLNATSNVVNKCGLNAADAANAMACLQHIDMIGAIENPHGAAAAVPANAANAQPMRSDGNAFTQQDVANAWRLAIELEGAGEAGFNLLKHLMNTPAAPGHALHPTVGRQRDSLLHTYLQTAREKVQETQRLGETLNPARAINNRLMPDPLSIHHHVNNKLNAIGRPDNNEPGQAPADGVHVVGAIGGRVLPTTANPATSATLLDKALKAVSNHMQQVQAHAANAATAGQQITFDRNHGDIRPGTNPATFRLLNKDCNWWAANAVRNGIYSDAPGDEGNALTKLYNKITGRTDRVAKYYPKILERSEKVNDWLQRANNGGVANGPMNTWDKFERRTDQSTNPKTGKSPFNVFNNIVVKSPHRLKGATDASGIADGRALKQNMIQQLEKAIEQTGFPPAVAGAGRTPLRSAVYPPGHAKAGQAAVQDNPPAEVLQQMVRIAILKQQHRFPDGGNNLFITRYLNGDPLTFEDIGRAKQRVFDMLAGGEAGQNINTLLAVDRLFGQDHENVQLSPETLVRWAKDVGASDAVPGLQQFDGPWANEAAREAYIRGVVANSRANPAPAPAGWAQADWNKFVDGVERVMLGEVKPFDQPITDLSNLRQKDAGRLFEAIIKRQELGHVLQMRDGGWQGVKTQGISYIVSRILSGGTQSIGADLRLLRGKHAEIQSGTGTGGRDLFVGTTKATRTQVGGGYVFGPGHVSKKGDGWSTGLAVGGNLTLHSGEWAEKNGVIYRFRRTFSGVDSDDIGNAQLGRLTRKLMDPGHDPRRREGGPWTNPGDPNDQGNMLKQILHEFDDVSVGYLKSKDRTLKGGLSAAATASLKVGPWGPGAGVGVGVEHARSKTTWVEEGGSSSQQRDITAHETKVNVTGLLSLVAATLKNLDIPADSPLQGLAGSIKAAFQDGAMAGADIVRTGTSRRHTWIYHDGALTYTPGISSFYQKTHKNAAAFAVNVSKRIEQLAHDKAKVFESNRYYHAGAAADPRDARAREDERIRMIDQEMIKLLEDLHNALKGAKPTQEFREYFEYSPKYIQMINDLESLIRSEKSDPNWKANSGANARVADYEKQVAKLKALDDETIRQHGEYRFNITDNVESKTKNLGLNSFLVNTHEDVFRGQRIDIYN